MPTKVERLTEQLHVERTNNVQETLVRELTDRDIPLDEARKQVHSHNERFEVNDRGEVMVRLPSGGLVPAAKGVPMLASHIFLSRARDAATDPEREAAALDRKRFEYRGIL